MLSLISSHINKLLFTVQMRTLVRVTLLGLILIYTPSYIQAQCGGCNHTNPATLSNFDWHNDKVCITATTTVTNNAVANAGAFCSIHVCNGANVHFRHNANLQTNGCSLTLHSGTCTHDGPGSYSGHAACTAPMPVHFGELYAIREHGTVVLEWETYKELNNQYFIIQRSLNGRFWENLDTLAGAGYSDEVLSYQYVDDTPIFSDVMYRVWDVDYDGVEGVSNIVALEQEEVSIEEVHIYPNPAYGSLSFDEGIVNPGKVELVNQLGQIEVTEAYNVEFKLSEIDVSMLESGKYELIVTNKEGVLRKSFIKL